MSIPKEILDKLDKLDEELELDIRPICSKDTVWSCRPPSCFALFFRKARKLFFNVFERRSMTQRRSKTKAKNKIYGTKEKREDNFNLLEKVVEELEKCTK
jgi:hypothetical protein